MNATTLALLIALATGAVAPAPAPPRCDAPAHRAFDFWLGEWEVWSNDMRAGTNRIEKLLDGCAIAEYWRGASGVEGRSYNAYDPALGRWRQFWVATGGGVLLLEGGPRDGGMLLEGMRPNPRTRVPQRQRIEWIRNADGSVRQLWQTSDDDGATWQVAFDGRYRRIEREPPR
ncbi:MAG TPA: hypothetical protein VND91_10050 [Candidatus Saccharimonadia bacterium]|nr:hypothetical protein [Candidatus Saccharimonadia bacterium]